MITFVVYLKNIVEQDSASNSTIPRGLCYELFLRRNSGSDVDGVKIEVLWFRNSGRHLEVHSEKPAPNV